MHLIQIAVFVLKCSLEKYRLLESKLIWDKMCSSTQYAKLFHHKIYMHYLKCMLRTLEWVGGAG
jgi:hypothetical protein